MHASRVLVPGERERRGERDVVAGEVVLPAGRPPIPLEAGRRAHDTAADLHDARGVDRLRQGAHRCLIDRRIPVTHDPQVPVHDAVRRRALREHLGPEPGGERGALQQGHREEQLLVRGRRPLDPCAVPVEPRVVEADRDGHVVPADGVVDVLDPARRRRDRGRGSADHDDGQDRDHGGSRTGGEAQHARRIRQAIRATREPIPDRSGATMPDGGRARRSGRSRGTGRRRAGSRLRASPIRQYHPEPARRRDEHRSDRVTTIDRARLSRLMERERDLFRERHPRSRELFEAGRSSMLWGVPMNWMVRWPGDHPGLRRRSRRGPVPRRRRQRLRGLLPRGHGGMAGHAPKAAVEEIARQAARGITTMLPTEDAAWVSRELARRFGVPYWSFTLTATDANRFAIRWARHITGTPQDPRPQPLLPRDGGRDVRGAGRSRAT